MNKIPAPLLEFGDRIRELDLAGERCIYFLVDEFDRIIYIGKSNSFWLRLSSHSAMGYKRVFYLPIKAEDDLFLSDLELALIRLIRPPNNKTGRTTKLNDTHIRMLDKYGVTDLTKLRQVIWKYPERSL